MAPCNDKMVLKYIRKVSGNDIFEFTIYTILFFLHNTQRLQLVEREWISSFLELSLWCKCAFDCFDFNIQVYLINLEFFLIDWWNFLFWCCLYILKSIYIPSLWKINLQTPSFNQILWSEILLFNITNGPSNFFHECLI